MSEHINPTTLDSETAPLPGTSLRKMYKTQIDAVSFIKSCGFKLAKSKFSADVKRGKIPRNAKGFFKESALLGYAEENLTSLSRLEKAVAEDDSAPQVPKSSFSKSYKTQLDAVAFLQVSGFKVEKSKFHNDVKRGRVPRNAAGRFEEGALLGYAAANLPPLSTVENKAAGEAMVNRAVADTDLKVWQGQRLKLKLEKEQGLLMPRADHERDLSARAQLFKNETEGQCRRLAPKIIDLVVEQLAALDGVDAGVALLLRNAAPNIVPLLTEYLLSQSEELMDSWAADRDFVVEIGEDAEPGETNA